MNIYDPEDLKEVIKLIQEYLIQGGSGFDAEKLERAIPILEHISDEA